MIKDENVIKMMLRQSKMSSKQNCEPDRILKERVRELQDKLINRDKKINELSSDLSDLMIKFKRYKKKYEQD